MASKGAQLEGFAELERGLKSLGQRVQRRVMRSAVNASATPVLKAARAKAPKQSGLLKRSLGRKVVTNTKRQSVTAIIGPRKKVQGEHKGKPRKPSRYAHLAEKGHIDAHGNYIPGQPFLNPAMAEQEGAALNTLKQKLGAGIAKEAAKGAK